MGYAKEVLVLVCLLLAGLVFPQAAQAQPFCFFVDGVGADGKLFGPYNITNLTDDIGLGWPVQSGRSYFLEAVTSGPGGVLAPTVNIDAPPPGGAPFCPTTDITSGVSIRDVTPAPLVGWSVQKSVVVAVVPASGGLMMRVHNTNSNSFTGVLVSVVDTTLFSPRWSTFGGFYSSWGIENTTNLSCSYTLKVINTAGATVATATGTINAGLTAFRDTRASDLNVAANQSGGVTLTHNCPPGGIQADAFMVNENVSPPVVVPVKFEPARQQR